MAHVHLDAEFAVYMLCQMLCRVDTAMLSAGTSEREHKVGKSTVDIALYMSVSQLIYTFEKGKNLTVVLKESYYGLVESCEFLVWLIASGIVSGTAVEYIASAIARSVLRNALTVREAEHAHSQRALAVVLGESSRTVLRMCYIHVAVGCLVAVGTRCGWLFDMRILRQFGQTAQQEIGRAHV